MGALEDNNYALMTSNFDGTEPVEIVQADLSFAAWSPDSNQLAYNTWTPRSHFIAQSGVAGSGVLATTESDQFTWVSSDRFIYLSMASPNWEIQLGSIGAPSTLIATLPDGDRFPSLVFNGLPLNRPSIAIEDHNINCAVIRNQAQRSRGKISGNIAFLHFLPGKHQAFIIKPGLRNYQIP